MTFFSMKDGLFLFTLSICILAIQAEEEPYESSLTFGRNASREAYHKFHLTLAGEEEGIHHGHRHLQGEVFKDGSVQPGWIQASKRSEYNSSQTTWTQFRHDQYTDRIAFEFSFGSFLTYDIRKPVVTASNDKTAKPKVIDFEITDDDSSGSFTIVYDCQYLSGAQPQENITVSVVLPIVSGLSLYFSFLKTCGGGKHKYIEFGYFEESSSLAFEVNKVPFQANQSIFTLGPHVMSTRIYIHLHYPGKSQEFFHVTTNTSNASLSVHVRGPVFGGVVRPSESTIIHVLYDCRATGVFKVSIQIPIWPFQPLSGLWRKDCGGGLARGLNVGTTLHDKNSIVASAETRENWRLALYATSASIGDQAPVVNTSIPFKNFWLSNDGIPIHVAPAVITVENQVILAAYASSPERADVMFNTDGGGLLPTGSKLRLRVHMVCKRRGKSLVMVIIPIKSFANVEFGFVKLCRNPRRRIEARFLRTADSVTGMASMLLAALLGYWWHKQLRCGDAREAGKTTRRHRRV